MFKVHPVFELKSDSCSINDSSISSICVLIGSESDDSLSGPITPMVTIIDQPTESCESNVMCPYIQDLTQVSPQHTTVSTSSCGECVTDTSTSILSEHEAECIWEMDTELSPSPSLSCFFSIIVTLRFIVHYIFFSQCIQ